MYNIDRKKPRYSHYRSFKKGGMQLIVETEYGYMYNGIEYATYSEAEQAKAKA